MGRKASRNAEPDSAATDQKRSLLPLGTFVLTCILYAGLYFSADPLRITSLNYLFAPDTLALMWCGGRFEYFSLIDRWPLVAAASLILAVSWVAGRLAIEGLGLAASLDRLERFVLATAIGLNLLSTFALAVGLAGGLNQKSLFWTAIAILFIAGGALAWRMRGQQPKAAKAIHGDGTRQWLWCLAGIVPYVLITLLGSMLPPWEYDVREYHLQAPKEWFLQGRITFLPHNIYGNMPLGAELNSVWAMNFFSSEDAWWWGALTGKLVMATYVPLTALGLVAFGRRAHSLAAGMIAATVYVATPWIVHGGVTGYNEGPLGLYALTAIYALWLAGRQPSESAGRLVALSGYLAGTGVACKYPAAVFLVTPLFAAAVALPWLRRIKNQPADIVGPLRPAVLAGIVFAIGATIGGGLWLAKNVALTGNPAYPLVASVLDGETRTPEKDRQWTRVHSPQPDQQGRRFSLSQLGRDVAILGWRTRWPSLCLLPLAAMAWWNPRTRFLATTLAVWLLFVFATWWLLTHRLDRFLVPALPLVALLAGLGAVALEDKAWRLTSVGFVAMALLIQLPLVALPAAGDNRFFAPLQTLREDNHQLFLGGQRVNPAHRLLNELVRPGNRALLVGDAQPFDLEVDVIYNTCFDDCQFTRLFQGRSREERLAALRSERITHILFDWVELRRFRSPGNYGYTSDYVTPELVHDELVREQGLLRRIDGGLDPDLQELYEVAPR